MLIKIRDVDCSEVWDGVFYKKLSNYPHITKWETRNILDFIAYEKSHGRTCKIECEDRQVLDAIENAIQNPTEYKFIPRPKRITECTACPYRGDVKQSLFATPHPLRMRQKFLNRESYFQQSRQEEYLPSF